MDERGGTVWCDVCGQVLAYVNPENPVTYLQLLCRCGNSGYLELSHEGLDLPEKVQPAQCEPRVVKCADCGQTLFSVSDRTAGYAFRIRCTCGGLYNMRHICRRSVYRELMAPKRGLHNNKK